ncbi:MAG: enoyl-CoA hydratase/isomerase family protein [Myxococcota bacterium]
MRYETLLYDVVDRVATITFNRPDKLNAYTLEMGEEAYDAFTRSRDDDSVGAIVFTGAGRGFCAGVDLDHLKAQGASGAVSTGPKLGEEDFVRKLPTELIACPKPAIAAINGACIGVGVTVALLCDVRIAAADAKLGLTFARLGLLPGLGSTHLLPRLVGTARALELVLTAEVIRGDAAATIGLVNRAVPAGDVVKEARATAEKMLRCDPMVLAAAKRALHFGAGADLASAMENERRESTALRAQETARRT